MGVAKKLAPPALVDSTFVIKQTLGAPVVADPDRIVTAVDWGDGTLTIAAQPDVPRNVTVALTDANNSITDGTMTITGTNIHGTVVTETVTFTQAKAGFTGSRIFAVISSVEIADTDGTVGAGVDQLTVGIGNVIGLPSPISASAAVKHVYLGGTRVASPTIATGAINSGVNVAAATYNGSKALDVYYCPHQ